MTVPQIGMSSMPQDRLGVIGRAMRLVGNHMHFVQFKNNCKRNSQNCTQLRFTSCNFLTVIGTIILELHSNVCDYLYKMNFFAVLKQV